MTTSSRFVTHQVVNQAPAAADGFVSTRLPPVADCPAPGTPAGGLPRGLDLPAILARAQPVAASSVTTPR